MKVKLVFLFSYDGVKWAWDTRVWHRSHTLPITTGKLCMGNKRFSCGVVTPHFDLSKVRYRLHKSYLIFKAKRGCANNKSSIYSWIINFYRWSVIQFKCSV